MKQRPEERTVQFKVVRRVVIIDDDTHELFEMSKRDDDPEQKPAFLVTQSTANLVRQDFERYEPSLERMAEEWQEN